MSDYPVQTERAVAYRALCLGTLLRRNALELGLREMNNLPEAIQEGWQREHEGIHQHLKKWVVEEKISNYFSEEEQMLLSADLGQWQQMDTAKILWRCEALGILLWSLEVVEVPYYDTQFDSEALLEPLDLMSPTIDFIWQATLRPSEVIHNARDLAEKWHWRANIIQQRERGESPDDTSFTDLIKQVAEATYAAGNLPNIIENDFPVLGKAYARLTDEEYTRIASLAKERHYALNWLCKYSDDWDNVPTSTIKT